MLKIGYHYTSLECYKSVQKDGIIPYPISKENEGVEFSPIISTNGIWTWLSKLTPLEHAASIIYQTLHRSLFDIVVIKFRYNYTTDIYRHEGREVIFKHYYNHHPEWHKDVPAVIVTKIVPITNIINVRSYNLIHLLWRGNLLFSSAR